jgi:hypothetical protein
MLNKDLFTSSRSKVARTAASAIITAPLCLEHVPKPALGKRSPYQAMTLGAVETLSNLCDGDLTAGTVSRQLTAH